MKQNKATQGDVEISFDIIMDLSGNNFFEELFKEPEPSLFGMPIICDQYIKPETIGPYNIEYSRKAFSKIIKHSNRGSKVKSPRGIYFRIGYPPAPETRIINHNGRLLVDPKLNGIFLSEKCSFDYQPEPSYGKPMKMYDTLSKLIRNESWNKLIFGNIPMEDKMDEETKQHILNLQSRIKDLGHELRQLKRELRKGVCEGLTAYEMRSMDELLARANKGQLLNIFHIIRGKLDTM